MKTEQIYVLLLMLFIFSCGKEDDYEMPEIQIKEPEIPGEIIGVEAVKNTADYENGNIYTFEGTNNYMEAYVVSSDEAGNFYHELVVQDAPENPTSGIKILLNKAALFQTYEFGRKIFVKLDGLSVGVSNGVPVLGMRNNGNVAEIPFPIIEDHVLRSTHIAEIQPLQIQIDEFSEASKNLYVEVQDVQFFYNLVSENPVSFAAEPTDEYDGERMLISCQTGATTFVSTSTYSDFKFLSLPSGKGNVKGILARNFYDDFFVLNLNAPGDINFSSPNRCDPTFLECSGSGTGGLEFIFYEDFQSISNTASISTALGWDNVNVSGTSGIFAYKNSYGNKFVTISAYETGEVPMTSWLVTPEINLDGFSNEQLSFNARASFDNGTILSVYITQNYTGNPLTTEWTQLNAAVPIGPAGAAPENFSISEVDISCLNGNVRIGFRYHGSDPDRTTTYDIDNVQITGQLE